MRLKDLDVWVVGNPPPHFGGRYFIFLRLRTECGIEGVGEVYTATFGPEVVRSMIEDVFARYFLDVSPFEIEATWRRVYGSGYTMRPDMSLISVLSGLEIACWDIIGKATEQPVHALLGGRVHERLRTYTYVYPDASQDESMYHDVQATAERALHYVDQGFTAIKFDPMDPYTVFDGRQPSLTELSRAERFVTTLRKAVGDRADLLFGTHGQFTPSGALRLAKRIESADPLWFEEPVPPDYPEGMAQVARQTHIPVATGERLCTKYEFARVLETNAASILQMALGRVGGLMEGKKIAGMAETHHALIAPHLYCGPIEGAANAQLAACTPNFLILESIERWENFHADILVKSMQWEQGYLVVPTEPGLGVELNVEVAEAHPYTGDALHLEMTPSYNPPTIPA
ncbi:mandelate racemase/muconate lactonizing enzyme family protein [uncultured Tateyamaria sp.]|uniref:mandelate racemase/muconate lactonizing enzyme family protein n=1 Tax=uncultured Tateyamaria sp. TaxID=455651 RepID=UPI0026118C46|nr:mandelate racemase/muconate lactonizing enzyme family protein [uncultured Tateyamaria sp.]